MCYTKNYPFSKEDLQLKTTKFKEIAGSDYDTRLYSRSFTGKMTKGRWKVISTYCRLHSFTPHYHCSHEWDCCGCFCGQTMYFEYKHNQLTIFFRQSFNY